MDRIWLRKAPGETVESLPVTRVITDRQVRRVLIGVAEALALMLFIAGISGGVMAVALIAGGF